MTGGEWRGAGDMHDSPYCDLKKSHCFEHGDERIPRRTFVICFECGHVWTKRSLRWRYIREHVGMWRKKDEWGGRRYGFPWRTLFVRARDIFFCQECIHDF